MKKIKKGVKVYVEGGGSGANSASLQSELRRGFAEFFAKTDLGSTRRPSVVACGGREQAFDSFRTAIEQGEQALLLVDSETALNPSYQSPQDKNWKPWAHLKAQAGWVKPAKATDDDCHLMVQCMENWFLADKASVAAFFGQGFKEAALPSASLETVFKETVYAALQTATQSCKTKGVYGKGAHSFKLLRSINPAHVEAESPWAKRFLDELRKRMP